MCNSEWVTESPPSFETHLLPNYRKKKKQQKKKFALVGMCRNRGPGPKTAVVFVVAL